MRHWRACYNLSMRIGRFCLVLLSLVALLGNSSFFVLQPASAASQLKSEVDDMNSQIQEKRSQVKEVQGLISTYQDRIKAQESQQATLANQILLLDNRVREKELRIQETKSQIDLINLELKALNSSIASQEEKIVSQKAMAADLIRRLRQMDDISTLYVFLSRPTLSSYLDRVEELKRVEGDLTQTLQRVSQEKLELEQTKKDREAKMADLVAQKKTLAEDAFRLDQEKNAKTSLLAETKDKQEEFARALDELRQQREQAADEIATLEKTLKDKLDTIDVALANGETLLLWPVPLRKITVTFHDPTYPFRNLFEHPGIDLRADVGTPIRAAAGGYVAWNKTGKMYGNYVMIIHPGNIATVYGHLSRFAAKPNTYIERGDIIGYTGGMPGTQGAGLSTGPHLHFEVRQDGIPVDPMGFLPEAIETDTIAQQ